YNFFQDVRRYQNLTANLDIQVINVNGRIELPPDMVRVPISKLSQAEKKEFIEYLKMRITRGDNIGSSWAFFRSLQKKPKTPVMGFGANIVHSDAQVGQDRARALLAKLQKSKLSSKIGKSLVKFIGVTALISAVAFGAYKYGYKEKLISLKWFTSSFSTPEMQFYEDVFPEVYAWKSDDRPFTKKIADDLLKPEYVQGILSTMDQEVYQEKNPPEQNRARRLALFVYFNYNSDVAKALKKHRVKLEGTEFMRLAQIYSTQQSGYSSNIFYFKVGDLDLKHSEISRFLTNNMITYQDYKKLRDVNAFSDLLQKDGISYKMKNFLEDVYTLTPLRIREAVKNKKWFLLTRTNKNKSMDFAAFFNTENATLVPKRVGDVLLNKPKTKGITWYALDDATAEKLKLSTNALTYFSKPTGQALKLEVIASRIRKLGLKPTKSPLQVTVHRELLMGDSKGKYGVQCYDPITGLVLANLITRSSFEKEGSVSLKRDPIQVNTTLVQLSKDDSFSVQTITITPGKTGIIRMFEPQDSFRASFSDGTSARFEKATGNLFNPFSFMVFNDSITFSCKNDITDMVIDMGKHRLKITKSMDGNHQIKEIN
ncbi:MAG: hypothetical protein MI747_09355, partial [Desulfobacterales bacterium]|nr:hypothetical protein [Desulfobacterales bacterium]